MHEGSRSEGKEGIRIDLQGKSIDELLQAIEISTMSNAAIATGLNDGDKIYYSTSCACPLSSLPCISM